MHKLKPSQNKILKLTNMIIDEQGQPTFQIKMIRQCNNHIHNVEPPYHMETT